MDYTPQQISDIRAGGPLTPRAGACGSQDLGGVTTAYRLCTDWRRFSTDFLAFLGDHVTLSFLVHEVGGDTGEGTTLAVRNVHLEVGR